MAYGGFRGSVGIGKCSSYFIKDIACLQDSLTYHLLNDTALALSLYARLMENTENLMDSADKVHNDKYLAYQHHANTLFCMVGGVALLTLLVNGVTSKPLLQLVRIYFNTKFTLSCLPVFDQLCSQNSFSLA